MIECIVEMLKENDPQPRVVQELVRCKDCIYYVCADVDHIVGCEWCRLTRTIKKPDWFCADGEKWSET